MSNSCPFTRSARFLPARVNLPMGRCAVPPGRRLTVAGVAVALALLPHIPAQAALPKSKPTETKLCPNNPKKKARVWLTSKNFAAENPCNVWLQISYTGESSSDSTLNLVNVARNSKFNRSRDMSSQRFNWGLHEIPQFCEFDSGVVYFGDGYEWFPTREGNGLTCEEN